MSISCGRPGRLSVRFAAGTLLLSLAAMNAGMASASAQPYTLGPQDKLRLRVVEWQTAEGTFRDWSAVSGEYVVGPSGQLAIPMVGEIGATGRSTNEIATEVGNRLQENLGLADRPEAALELIEYRPFYISGDVQTPSAYPFAPGLTVAKAVSLAGGARRAADQNMRLERDVVGARGEREVLISQYKRLLMRKARLRAEIDGASTFERPAELADSAESKALVTDETAILRADAQRLNLQLAALADLKALLQNEVVSLDSKKQVLSRQLEIERGQLKDVTTLASKGLAVNTRVSDIERSVSDIEGQLLDLDVASLRAKQDINKGDQDAVGLRNDRDAKLAADLQEADGELDAARLKIKTQEGLMAEAIDLGASTAVSGVEAQVTYTITRNVEGKNVSLPAEIATELLPGDVVEVKNKSISGGF